MHVAIQGEEGSFHHQAAKEWFGEDVDIAPSETFSDVFGAINRYEAKSAVIAVENSLYGSINEVLDLIEAHQYPIVGEVYLRIEQQLIALPGAKPENIKRIYSHPVALAQCEHYLDTHYPNAERIEYRDTAASVALVKQLNDPTVAAIAGRTAAKLHGLPVLAKDIEDNTANFTRFLVLGPASFIPKNSNKASLVLITDHTPGALARVLSIFADRGINLTKLQSRPIIGRPWEYRFYLDVEASGEQLDSIMNTVQTNGASVTVLGRYAAAINEKS